MSFVETYNAFHEYIYDTINCIKIYDGTTLALRARYANSINYYKNLTRFGEKLFSELIPSTLTAQGEIHGIIFMEEDLIKVLKIPEQSIMKITCNYGSIVHPDYVIHDKVLMARKAEQKAKKEKDPERTKRRMQGDGSCFSSQITFYVKHPDIVCKPQVEVVKKSKRGRKQKNPSTVNQTVNQDVNQTTNQTESKTEVKSIEQTENKTPAKKPRGRKPKVPKGTVNEIVNLSIVSTPNTTSNVSENKEPTINLTDTSNTILNAISTTSNATSNLTETKSEVKAPLYQYTAEELAAAEEFSADIYKIKLFRNGVFQVAGVTQPDMSDLFKPIGILHQYLQPYFANPIKIDRFISVMRNYKVKLLNKHYHIDLEKCEKIIGNEKNNEAYNRIWDAWLNVLPRYAQLQYMNYIKKPNPMQITSITYNTERCFSLNIKFSRPSIVDPTKEVTVKLLKKGKINFDGGNSQQEIEEIYHWLEYLYNKHHDDMLCDIRLVNNETDPDTSDCSAVSIYDKE